MRKITTIAFTLLAFFLSNAHSENNINILGTYLCSVQTINKVENYLNVKLAKEMNEPVFDNTDAVHRKSLEKIDDNEKKKVQDQLKVLYNDGHNNAQKDIIKIVQSIKMMRLIFEKNNIVILNTQSQKNGKKHQESGTYSIIENLITIQWCNSIEKLTILDAGNKISLTFIKEFPFPLFLEKIK